MKLTFMFWLWFISMYLWIMGYPYSVMKETSLSLGYVSLFLAVVFLWYDNSGGVK